MATDDGFDKKAFINKNQMKQIEQRFSGWVRVKKIKAKTGQKSPEKRTD